MKEIRKLRADEIEIRVAMVKETGYSVLLYKDARVDMRILDEVFGPMNWQRRHEVINDNLFCTVSIWDEEKQQWIEKQDVGVPSYTQGEKGEASDSFKRACFNVGIGRELYTAPFIWISPINDKEIRSKKGGGGYQVYTKLHVSHIDYDKDRNITELEIKDSDGNVRFKRSQNGFNAYKSNTRNNNQKQQANKNNGSNDPMNYTFNIQGEQYTLKELREMNKMETIEWIAKNYKVKEVKEAARKIVSEAIGNEM